MCPPSQLIIDALNTATLHIYIQRMEMNPPGQSIIDALHTIHFIYIYIWTPLVN